MNFYVDRRGDAPPITGRCAAIGLAELSNRPQRQPQRLHRTRKKHRATPPGAVYVGRPTIWANPFANRYHICHARSVILYAAWLRGDCSPRVLKAAGFSLAETDTLIRRRLRVIERMPRLVGKNLQCWCPTSSAWCHADVLLSCARQIEEPHP